MAARQNFLYVLINLKKKTNKKQPFNEFWLARSHSHSCYDSSSLSLPARVPLGLLLLLCHVWGLGEQKAARTRRRQAATGGNRRSGTPVVHVFVRWLAQNAHLGKHEMHSSSPTNHLSPIITSDRLFDCQARRLIRTSTTSAGWFSSLFFFSLSKKRESTCFSKDVGLAGLLVGKWGHLFAKTSLKKKHRPLPFKGVLLTNSTNFADVVI